MTETLADRTISYRQRLITECVLAFKRLRPFEYSQLSKDVREMRNTRANEFGADKAMELRIALRIPEVLWNTFDELIKEPKIFHERKELLWFMRTFPEFRVPLKT